MVRTLSRLLLVVALLGLAVLGDGRLVAADAASAPGAAVPTVVDARGEFDDSKANIDAYVERLNPDVRARIPGATPGSTKPKFGVESTFTNAASDLAREVNHNFWFSFLLFMPFLILPQVLLVYVMVKFKSRNDGRKPATFMHHNALEITWTLIPVFTLIIVGIPAYPLLVKMDAPPPKVDSVITVRASQFKFDYDYKRENIQTGIDEVGAYQEPMVLVKDRTVSLSITSNDVNHAWWIPAFGVKKDAIIARFNHCWFTPTRLGVYKGQCAELCGRDHGKMYLSAVVIEPAQYEVWKTVQRHRGDAKKVWTAILAADPAKPAEEALKQAVAKYLDKSKADPGEQRKRVFALKYWIASNLASKPREGLGSQAALSDFLAAVDKRRALLDQVVAGALAAVPTQSTETPVAAATTRSPL